LPARALWLDYALRALLIGCGAWLGARWLAAPMQRLTRAAHALPQGLEQGRPPAALDEDHGTLEVRETARVFNQMAQRLQRQFDQRSLHMAAVSHDLRTPLTRLRLRLERLSDDAVAQAAIADLREMDELIESSLAVMREQSGDTATAEVDLGALLQSLVDDLAEQGQAVSMDDGAPPVRVRAHTASLRRIVGNLVGNALRYGQRARVAMATQADQVSVTVDDNGPGIPPDRLEQVFEPWVRLEGVQRPGGNGLGLAIARDLALREGGSLTLTNRPEGGLRATLSLPVV
jgi:protein-histidine pros-kinase